MAYETNYPTTIPDYVDLPDYADNVDDVEAIVVNNPKKELLAGLIELGIHPSGSMATLTARLAVSLNDDGTLKSTLTPTFAGLTLTGELDLGGNLQIQDTYTIKHTGSSSQWLEIIADNADLGWYWDATGFLAFKYDNDQIFYMNATDFGVAKHIVAWGGIHVGANVDANYIDDATHGDGSTPLYIGSFWIVVSVDTTGGDGSAGVGKQYVTLKIGTNRYKILHDGTV